MPRLVFGFQEEWLNFEKRNTLFLERFSNLSHAFQKTFVRATNLSEPIDKFVFMYGRVCLEDFFEILLCCGNGSGLAAQKLLRGLYERTVTLRYLHENPSEVEDFLDFYWITQHKLMIASMETMGKDVFPSDAVDDINKNFLAVQAKFMVTDCKKCGTKRLNHTWNKLNFVAMAQRTHLGQLIVPGYYLPLREAHGTIGSMLSRIESTLADGVSFKDIAQRKPADAALRVSHNLVLDVLTVEDEHFNVPELRELIEMCRQDFMDIWQKDRH